MLVDHRGSGWSGSNSGSKNLLPLLLPGSQRIEESLLQSAHRYFLRTGNSGRSSSRFVSWYHTGGASQLLRRQAGALDEDLLVVRAGQEPCTTRDQSARRSSPALWRYLNQVRISQ